MSSLIEVLFKIGDGCSTRFWEDTWLGDTPLKSQYPSLYNIVQQKNVSVNNVLSISPTEYKLQKGANWSHVGHMVSLMP